MQTDNNDIISIAANPGFKPIQGRTFDHALVALTAEGDRRAFKLLFMRHKERIYRFAVRYTRNATLADDVVAATFLSLWRSAHQFRSECQVSTWLLSIARHRALSTHRHCREASLSEADTHPLVDHADDPETTANQATRSAVIQKCLAQLTRAQSEIIDLVYYQEKSIREVGYILGIPEGTVKTRMFYARRALATLLKSAGIHTSSD